MTDDALEPDPGPPSSAAFEHQRGGVHLDDASSPHSPDPRTAPASGEDDVAVVEDAADGVMTQQRLQVLLNRVCQALAHPLVLKAKSDKLYCCSTCDMRVLEVGTGGFDQNVKSHLASAAHCDKRKSGKKQQTLSFEPAASPGL